jgi:hypothetical protein
MIIEDQRLEPNLPQYLQLLTDPRPKAAAVSAFMDSETTNVWNRICDQTGYVMHPRLAGLNVQFRLPKDLKWSSYPVLGSPAYKLMYSSEKYFDLVEWSSSTILVNSSVWILESHDGKPNVLSSIKDAIIARRLMELENSVKIMTIRDGKLVDVDLSPYLEQERLELPWQRFLWSYAANWDALGGKALKMVLEQYPWSKDQEQTSARELMDPWCIQLLFACRRAAQGKWEGEAIESTLHCNGCGVSMIPGMVAGQDCISWPGSGRYAPLLSEQRVDFRNATVRLIKMGLIQFQSQQRWVQIQPRGQALLELLPKNFEDPDVFLRWHKGKKGLPHERESLVL